MKKNHFLAQIGQNTCGIERIWPPLRLGAGGKSLTPQEQELASPRKILAKISPFLLHFASANHRRCHAPS